MSPSRREFLIDAAVAVGAAVALPTEIACAGKPQAPAANPRVVVIRHESLAAGGAAGLSAQRVRGLLDEAAKSLAGCSHPRDAWARWFRPGDRVGLKVNCLGHSTHPTVANALAAAIGAAGVPLSQVFLWDRTERELTAAGYSVRRDGKDVRCYATDTLTDRGNAGYSEEIYTSGSIGSLYSRIVTDETTALASVPVLKDHGIAGITGGLKNFYGAIHNPNKYHENGGDPFIADVCAHALIRDRLRLVVCDATRAQYNGGPSARPNWQWHYGGLILGCDPVAVDRVAFEILTRKRAAARRPTFEAESRPVRYLASARARGLGTDDLARIEVVSIGRNWMEVG